MCKCFSVSKLALCVSIPVAGGEKNLEELARVEVRRAEMS